MMRLIQTHKEFVKIRDQWNELLDNSGQKENVFLRHEWLDVWWRAFGAGKGMFVILKFSGSQLEAAAPLMLFKDSYKGIPYKRISFIEDPNAPSADVILAQGHEERGLKSLFGYLYDRKGQWTVADLNKIDRCSSTVTLAAKILEEAGARFLVRNSMASPYIKIQGEFSDFLAKTSSKFRRQLKHKFNKLNRAGKVDFVVYEDPGPNGKFLKMAMDVSRASWKHRHRTSMVSTPERREFFSELSNIAARNGWLRIWLLYLDDKPIATEFHLEYMKRTHAMRGDFDEAASSLSPGSVLEAHIIEECFRNNLSEYDFCGLPYGYKLRWTTQLHERRNLIFCNRSCYSYLLYAAQKYLPVMRGRLSTLAGKLGYEQ